MKKTLIIHLMRAGLFGFAILGLGSCTENPVSPTTGGSNVAMRTELDNSRIHSSSTISAHASPMSVGSGVDSMQVTSVAYAASSFMLRSDITDNENDPNLAEGFIRPPQFLLAFDVSGRQYIGENIIYAATYRRARFDVHPLQGRSDSLALALGPLYSSLFLAGESGTDNNTIVIRGYIWHGGIQMPFIYSTGMTGSGSVIFDQPLVVTTDSPMEVLVRFSSAIAFTDGIGAIMDPRDGRNAAAIDANMKGALKASLNIAGS